MNISQEVESKTNVNGEAGTPEVNEKKILIGKNQDGMAIVLEIELRDRSNTPELQYFSMSGEEFDLNDIIDESDGEDRAREYLEQDDYFWKEAVANDRTTKGFDDWIQEVLDIDGWEHVLGGDDLEYIGDGKYIPMTSCGQIDMHTDIEDMDKLLINKRDLKTLSKAWKTLHLKSVDSFNQKQKELWNKVAVIMTKYPEYKAEQLNKLLED